MNLGWRTSEQSRTKIASGTAITSPFALCPEKPYHFDIYSTPQILEFTATSRGFGQPIYSWWINGRPVTQEFMTVPAIVTVDDTMNPSKHTTTSGSSPTTASAMVGIELICERNPVVPSWREAILRVYTTPLDVDVIGHVDLTVEAEANEKTFRPDVPPDSPTSAVTWLTMHNETVVWEDQYTNDGAACRRQWGQITSGISTTNTSLPCSHCPTRR